MSEIRAIAEKACPGDEETQENYVWWYLYGDDDGFWRDKRDNKAVWWNGRRLKRRMRRREWIEIHVWIKAKSGKLVRFILNQGQRDLLAKIYRLQRAGKPVRIVILKARQVGFSTLIQALGHERQMRQVLFRGLLVAHRRDTSSLILGKIHIMRERLSRYDSVSPWRLSFKRSARAAVALNKPMESIVEVDSAEVEEPGHGDTLSFLHMSETARWPKAEDKAKGLENTVAELPETEEYDESTARGDHGYFRNKFYRAYFGIVTEKTENERVDDFSSWVGHFTPWYINQEYRWTALRNEPVLPERLRAEIERTLTPEERRLLGCRYLLRRVSYDAQGKQVGGGWKTVDYDQLAWRRWCKREKCQDDWSTFNEQYPGFPEDAFQASGRPVFDMQRITQLEQFVSEPALVGDIIESLDGETALKTISVNDVEAFLKSA